MHGISIDNATQLPKLKGKVDRKVNRATEKFQRIYIEFNYDRTLGNRQGDIIIKIKQRESGRG